MEKIEPIKNLAKGLLQHLGFDFPIEVVFEEASYRVSVEAGEGAALLIGYHGETLNSLQTILSLLVYRQLGPGVMVVVDVDGYRQERATKLKALAVHACDKARFLNMPQSLPPMNAFERRLIHLFVSEVGDMQSESVGEGRQRQVIIQPKSLTIPAPLSASQADEV